MSPTRIAASSSLAFPANDFAGQEPGTNEEIAEFCETKFAVEFPMFSKITVTGADKHPLYDALTKAARRGAGRRRGFPRAPARLRHDPQSRSPRCCGTSRSS